MFLLNYNERINTLNIKKKCTHELFSVLTHTKKTCLNHFLCGILLLFTMTKPYTWRNKCVLLLFRLHY
ncbi:hypothetical protein HanRHA438_Chr07g0317951 [Helianthus annuus]|nr:hypothetical protein HanRHA438_Chr07g0317951 [Helianthus annuus]